MKKSRAAVLFVGILGVVSITVAAGPFTGSCTAVLDGDTIQVSRAEEIFTVHLIAADAPEMAQPFGEEAAAFLEGLVLGGEVTIDRVSDVDSSEMSARVLVGDLDLALAILEAGFAWHDTIHDSQEELVLADIISRSSKRGLWADPEPVPPWEWRELHTTVVSRQTSKPRRLADMAAGVNLKKNEDGKAVITQPTPSAAGRAGGTAKGSTASGDGLYCCCELHTLDADEVESGGDYQVVYDVIERYTCENAFASIDHNTNAARVFKGCVSDVYCGTLP